MKASSLWLFAVLGALLVALTGCGEIRPEADDRAAMGPAASDEPSATAANIGQLSEQFYAAANEGNRQLAFAATGKLADAVAAPDAHAAGTPAGWEALERSVASAERLIRSGGAKADWYREASRIKLAADQLIHPKGPLWLQYEEVLSDDLDRMRKAWASQTADPARAALVQLHAYRDHVDRIEVAALMQGPESRVRELQLRIEYVGKLLNDSKTEADRQTVEAAFNALDASAGRLFGRSPDEPAMERLPEVAFDIRGREPAGEQLAVLFVSASVMGVLAFVGWRIYANERRRGTRVPPAGGIPPANGRRWW